MDVKYKTIYDSIKDKILNKEYPANSKIPDEISLCKNDNEKSTRFTSAGRIVIS